MEPADAELIAAVLDGDAASFEPLVARYSPRLFATARRYARDVVLSTADARGALAIDGAFDDNDFDLLPGESATVLFRPTATTTVAALREGLRVVSLVDSY